jgi:hypothetical protein
MWWVGYKNHRVSRSSLAIVVVLGIVVSSHTVGQRWFDYDVSSRNGVQSMFMAGGICIERKILRTGSNGYLLYSPAIKTFEFRPKDEIRVVYQDQCGNA